MKVLYNICIAYEGLQDNRDFGKCEDIGKHFPQYIVPDDIRSPVYQNPQTCDQYKGRVQKPDTIN